MWEDKHGCFIKSLYKEIENLLLNNKQIIFYSPSRTGKT